MYVLLWGTSRERLLRGFLGKLNEIFGQTVPCRLMGKNLGLVQEPVLSEMILALQVFLGILP